MTMDIAIMTMGADDDDETATSTAVMISIVAVRLPVDGILFGGRSAPCPLFYRQQHNHWRTQRPVPTAGANGRCHQGIAGFYLSSGQQSVLRGVGAGWVSPVREGMFISRGNSERAGRQQGGESGRVTTLWCEL